MKNRQGGFAPRALRYAFGLANRGRSLPICLIAAVAVVLAADMGGLLADWVFS